MVTAENLVYSRAAASRILGLAYREVAEVRPFADAVWVYLPGYRPRFMSKKLFEQHFVERRKQEALKLSVEQVADGKYVVSNPEKGSTYSVWRLPEGLECECHDWKNQAIFTSETPRCKHIYAVLNHLSAPALAA